MLLLQRFLKYSAFNLAMLLTRLWLGAITLKHSTNYLFGGKMLELTNYLGELGFPIPSVVAYFSQWTELITGILIILGLRIGAIILAVNMGVAVLFAHSLLIFTEAELPFNYFMFVLVISLVGSGKFSVDHLILKQTTDL